MEESMLEKRLESIEKLLAGQKNVLSFAEACEFASISKTYMYKLTCQNRIPHFKPHGKNIYFNREELESWLMQNPIKTVQQRDQEAANYVTLPKRRR